MARIDLRKPLQTVGGCDVTLTALHTSGEFPVEGYLDGLNTLYRWGLSGKHKRGPSSPASNHLDLRVSEEDSLVVQAIYPGGVGHQRYTSLEEAKLACRYHKECQGLLTLYYKGGEITSVTIHPKA